MKNTILIILFTVLSFSSYSQEETITISETERIVDKYGGEIVEKFNTLIKDVTPLAIEGFELVVKLQIARGVVYLVPTILCILFFIIFSVHYNKINNDENRGAPREGPFDEENITPQLIFTGGCSIITFIVALFHIQDAILYLAAPEWYAIKEIIGLF